MEANFSPVALQLLSVARFFEAHILDRSILMLANREQELAMTVVFETSQLRVRHLELTDIDGLHQLQGSVNVMRYCSGSPLAYEETRQQLESVRQHYATHGNSLGVWGVERIVDQAFVGTCALVGRSDNEDEIGYRILESFWRQGLGTELVAGLVQHWLRHACAEMLTACVYTDNVASWKIVERAGFQLVREFLSDDGRMDRHYCLLSPETRLQPGSDLPVD